MDFAEKIDKPNKIQSKIERFTSRTVSKSCCRNDTEDRRLKNWRKWLENREKTCNRLKNLTGRKSADLLINSYEKIRPKIAIKNLIEAATFEDLSEECKNDLNFWTVPEYLKNRRDPDNPEIAVSLTKKQLRIPRILSRVFLPELCQEEKSLELGEAVSTHRHDEYLRKKLKELSPQISKLNLKTRGIQMVAVKGKKIPQEEQIIFRFGDEEIIIGEDEIYMRRKKSELRAFTLDFFTRREETAERKICLENQSLLEITYEWQEIVLDAEELAKLQKSRSFYFDKHSGTILPGRCDDLTIWYHPASSGGHLESMCLDFDPSITFSPIIFTFWGICEQPKGLLDEMITYEDYLNVHFRNCLIAEIVEDLWRRVEPSVPQLPPYALFFRETEVFSSRNRHFFYHHEVVEELKEIYERISAQDPWALSISELQGQILHMDADVRTEMLQKFVELSKKLLKPSRNEFLNLSKFEAVHNLISAFFDKFLGTSEMIKMHCYRDKSLSEEENGDSVSSDLRGFHSTRSTEMRENFLYASISSLHSESNELYRDTEIYDIELYFEIFYARIYDLLSNTIEKICSSLDSINNLSL